MKFYQIQKDLKKGDMVYIDSGGVIRKVENMQKPTQHFASFFDEIFFGKYSNMNMTLLEVIDSDKAYIKWCFEHGVITVDAKIENRFNRKIGLDD